MSNFDIRLRQYTPGGPAGRVLPAMDISWTSPQSDIPTLSFKASETLVGTLPDLLEVAVEAWDGESWEEPDNGRFFVVKNSINDLDVDGLKSCTGVAMVSFILSNALLVNGDGKDREVKGSVGAFLVTALGEAQRRGVGGNFLGLSFAADKDSAGRAWNREAVIEQITFPDGEKLSAVLQILADQAFIEYSFRGRTLQVHNPGTGEDRSAGTGIVTVGSVSEELPVDTSLEDLATHIVVHGEEGASWTYPVEGAVQSLGRLEKSVEASGVTTEAQAALIAELMRAQGSRPRKQYTVTETVQAMASRPLADFNVGDWISARRPKGWERMRVVQLQVRKPASGLIEADIILADRLEDQITRLAKRNAALGARRAGNGKLGGDTTPSGYKPTPYLPTPGNGIGWGDGGWGDGGVANPPAEFTATDGFKGKGPEDSPAPTVWDGANTVFGFSEYMIDTLTYPAAKWATPAIDSRGYIQVWSGYLKDGHLVDYAYRGDLQLTSYVMQDLWHTSLTAVRPSSNKLSVDATTGVTVLDPYFVVSTEVKLDQSYPARGWFAEGWIYMPVELTVHWNVERGWSMFAINKQSTKFLRFKVTDLKTFGPLEGVAKAEVPNVYAKFATWGPHVAVSTSSPSGGNTAVYGGTFNPETHDVDEAGFSELPANADVSGRMVIVPSLDGKGGVSLVDLKGGELQLGDRIQPRTKETDWRKFSKKWSSYGSYSSFALVEGRAISASTGSPLLLNLIGTEGFTPNGRPVSEVNGTPNTATLTAYFEGRLYNLYGGDGNSFNDWSSAKVEPVQPNP